MKEELTTAELIKITEIPRRTIYRWLEEGLLPSWRRVPGRGPGQSNLFDKGVAVWAKILDEALKSGINFSGPASARVWLFSRDLSDIDPDSTKNYDGPLLLGDGTRIVQYLREHLFDLAVIAFAGKVGFPQQPSRERFVEFRIVPYRVAVSNITGFLDPRGPFLFGMDPHHLVNSTLVISVLRFSLQYDFRLDTLFR